MIRVLHSVSNMSRAGIETMIMNYYRHMDRTLIQFDFLCNKAEIGAYEPEIEQLGGHIYRSPGFNPIKFKKYVQCMRRIRKERNTSILHVHNGALGVYALCACKHAGVQTRVFHAHGTHLPHDFKAPYKAVCKKFINRYATHRFSCGAAAARFFFGPRLGAAGRYTLVTNALDPEKFAFNAAIRDHLRAEQGLTDAFVIGHVGRFSFEKNHERLLDMFAQAHKKNPRAILVFLGDGELMESVRERAKALALEPFIRFMGNVPNANEWYQAMDVFVLPSLWEGLPVVGVEAQASGLPCVISDAVTREVAVVKELVTFLPLKQSDDEWADALCAAHGERRDTRVDIRAAGYDIVEEAKKLQAFYLSVGGEHK